MKQIRRIFLDHTAGRGNPSSLHREGVLAAEKLADARRKVAETLHCQPDEIIFTSGGTESNNLAIFGLQPRHLVTTKLEHASILEPAKKFKTTFLPVNSDGLLDLTKFKKSLQKNTELVSVIYAHNEIGVLHDIRAIAKIIRKFKQENKTAMPYFHIDACQAPRYLELNVQKLGVDLLTLNGGKLGVPGAGCLFVRRGIKLRPILLGGGQENGLRSGTENVVGIVKFAKALESAQKTREINNKKVTKLRDYFIAELLKLSGVDVKLNGPEPKSGNRLANNVNVSFIGLSGEQIVLELDARGVACSTGAACGIPERNSGRAIIDAVRFTLSPETKKSDLDYVLQVLPKILQKLNGVKKLNKIIL